MTYVSVFNNLVAEVSPDDRVQVASGERQNRVRCGDVLFTASSESAEEVGMASSVTVEPPEPLYLNSFCFGFRPNSVNSLDPEFTKHLFRSAGVRRQIIRTANGVTRINISRSAFVRSRFPCRHRRFSERLPKFLIRWSCSRRTRSRTRSRTRTPFSSVCFLPRLAPGIHQSLPNG